MKKRDLCDENHTTDCCVSSAPFPLSRVRWLLCVPLVCSLATEQLQRDPTLDYHWDLWKKFHGKQYKEKVDGAASQAGRFCTVLFPHPRRRLGEQGFLKCCVLISGQMPALHRNKAHSCGSELMPQCAVCETGHTSQ